MTTHNLQLAAEPFQAILSGRKTIESRLYDEKRRLIHPGDLLIFINRDNPKETIEARVTGLLKYDTFHNLFSSNDPAKFGGPSVEWLESQINEFYIFDAQLRYGVIGIVFEEPESSA